MPILPPYGVFTRELRAFSLAERPLPDWRKNLPDATRVAQWKVFFQSTLTLFNTTLWPRWDYTASDWAVTPGGVDPAFAIALTKADFEVMGQLGLMDGSAVTRELDKLPELDLPKLMCGKHQAFFDEEDGRKSGSKQEEGIGFSYGEYDRDGDWFEPGTVKALFIEGMLAKDINRNPTASVGLPFKFHLQRPRPYQMALLLGQNNFVRETANSAPHPSMISGHCLQGLMAVGHIFHRLMKAGITLSAASRRALRQFMVDVGDRRVFAGVHYPSDNLSSYILAMLLVHDSFPPQVAPMIHREMWTAITGQSRVYRLMQESGLAAYDAALDCFQKHDPFAPAPAPAPPPVPLNGPPAPSRNPPLS